MDPEHQESVSISHFHIHSFMQFLKINEAMWIWQLGDLCPILTQVESAWEMTGS